VAAKIWRHAGRTGVSYSDQYEEKGVFERLMERLRRIAPRGQGYAPVMCRRCADRHRRPWRAVHRILCTASKRNGASNFGPGLGGIGLSGGVMK